MGFINILSIVICLNISTPDTVFKIYTYRDSIYVTSMDIIRIDTFNFDLICHLSKEMSDILLPIKYDSCQVYFRNKDWFLLQEYEIRGAHIPEGYYICTDFGKLMYKARVINIGYNYPKKIKKKRNYCKRYSMGRIFQPNSYKKKSGSHFVNENQ